MGDAVHLKLTGLEYVKKRVITARKVTLVKIMLHHPILPPKYVLTTM